MVSHLTWLFCFSLLPPHSLTVTSCRVLSEQYSNYEVRGSILSESVNGSKSNESWKMGCLSKLFVAHMNQSLNRDGFGFMSSSWQSQCSDRGKCKESLIMSVSSLRLAFYIVLHFAGIYQEKLDFFYIWKHIKQQEKWICSRHGINIVLMLDFWVAWTVLPTPYYINNTTKVLVWAWKQAFRSLWTFFNPDRVKNVRTSANTYISLK